MSCTKLGDLVDEYIIERDYDTRHNWQRLYNIAIRVLKEMRYDVSGTPTYEILTLDDTFRACVPDGMVKVLGLDIMTEQGLIPITPSSTKNPYVESKGVEIAPAPVVLPSTINTTEGFGFYPSDVIAARFKNGESIGHQFRGGGGNPFSYLHNYDTNKFEFSSTVAGTIVLSYLTNPNTIDGAFIVHPLTEDAIMRGIYYRDIRMKDHIRMGEKETARRDYYAAKDWARARLYSQRPKNISAANRIYYGQNPT